MDIVFQSGASDAELQHDYARAIPELLYPGLGRARLSGVHTKAAKKARL